MNTAPIKSNADRVALREKRGNKNVETAWDFYLEQLKCCIRIDRAIPDFKEL
jgi:hypothetical protein